MIHNIYNNTFIHFQIITFKIISLYILKLINIIDRAKYISLPIQVICQKLV